VCPTAAQHWVVGEADAGERLDVALAVLAGITRSQARRWIDAGLVRLDGSRVAASHRVGVGDAVEATPPEPLPSPLEPEPIPLQVLHEDQDLIVIDKPAGLVVHPAPGHPSGTLVNALLHHCQDLEGVGGVTRPGIVHRLDRGTSGVMVVAKSDAAHHALAEQFRDHSIQREYRALVRGLPGAETGRIERRIGRHQRDRKRMSVRVARGREATTAWRVLRRFPRSQRCWLAVLPETGRTHQIRVHLASAGLPIVGDPVYGRQRRRTERSESPATQAGEAERRRAPARLSRPALHAALLGFTHPRSGRWMVFQAPTPADLAAALEELARREAER
jgi:23S rRNA pseudouridine1911/1915/1917 synthase